MKIILILVILFTFWTQNADAKEISFMKQDLKPLLHVHFDLIRSNELANFDLNIMLSINDLWNKIKQGVDNAWNALKNIATKTKEKINVWIQDIKKRAEEVAKDFQEKLEVLKDKLEEFIQGVKDTAGDVKQCIENDKDTIQLLLKQIAIRVATCIAESVKNISVLDSSQSRLAFDDTEFMKKAEDKINECIQNVEDADACLNKARGEIYDDMEHTENDIMATRSSSRNIAEDALETILQCASDGVIKASGAIKEEVLKIINCVVEEKEKPFK